ncbi:MAG: primosomal protein N' [Actinomycetota bacterium]
MCDTNDREYVEVVVDSPVGELDRPFHYSLPEEFRQQTEIGSLVLVPFSNRLVLAYVVGFPDHPDVTQLKPVARLLDEPPLFDYDGQRLCRWISWRYLSPLSQAFRLLTPPGRSRSVRQKVTLLLDEDDAISRVLEPSAVDVVDVLAAAGGSLDMISLKKHLGAGPAALGVKALEEAGAAERRFALSEPAATPKSRLLVRLAVEPTPEGLAKLPERQHDLVDHLLARGGAEFQSDLLRDTGASQSSLKSLERKGLVEIADEEVLRNPRLGWANTGEPPEPNLHQREAIERIEPCISAHEHRVFLLNGVTGSGKTEVYLRSIERVLADGRGAIVLVPEISLTPQTVERFESRFPGLVAVLHSGLGPGERYDQWRGVREGRYRVVVGARSALFAPLADLGLIAIDEEHEPSYKSDTSPRYHAREVAIARARMCGAPVLLGSATPSLESVQRASAGIYEELVLPSRIDDRPMPQVEVVDMRQAGGAGEMPLLSAPMVDALSRTVQAGEQAILFLNRRGFSNYLQCRACGHIMGCKSCEVSLCYHLRGGMLLCHHCGARSAVPDRCPECGKGPMKGYGAGTQRVEEELAERLPGVATIRMDADTTATKDAHWRLLGDFRAGKAQVLIGTQMIAKGLDIPGVTLVGVINADTALALPDFRASERTYQLLTQVSGRAGRGLRPGRVVVQTFNPEHPAVRSLYGDTAPFIEAELATRRQALYPPFVELVKVLVTSPDARSAARSAARMKEILETDLKGTGAIILGPAPAPLSRLRGSFRWHILVKSGDLRTVAEPIKDSVSRFYDYARSFPAGKGVRISLDADPASLL